MALIYVRLDVYQAAVKNWMHKCFPIEVCENKSERNHRFIEEAIELVQSMGCSKEDVLKLVDYVYNRPVGEPHQEVGGVMITLAALCHTGNIDLDMAARDELNRIWMNIDKIREKQKNKPKLSPLPQ